VLRTAPQDEVRGIRFDLDLIGFMESIHYAMVPKRASGRSVKVMLDSAGSATRQR
jgi:hypothetical protein